MKVPGIRPSASEHRAAIPTAYAAALEQALAAIGDRGNGICLTGRAGRSRTALVEQLIAALPADVVVTRLTPAAAPADIATLIGGALEESRAAFGTPRILVAVDDADKLRRDTLDLLDELATLILDGKTAPQLLMVGDAALISRLTAIQHHAMLAYLGTRLTLPPLTPAETADYLASQGVEDSQLVLPPAEPVPSPTAAPFVAAEERRLPVWLISGLAGLGLFAAGGVCAWLLLPYLSPQATGPALPRAAEMVRPVLPAEPPAFIEPPAIASSPEPPPPPALAATETPLPDPPAEPPAPEVVPTQPDVAQATQVPEEQPGPAEPAEGPAVALVPDAAPPLVEPVPPEPAPPAPSMEASSPPDPTPAVPSAPEPAVAALPEPALPPRPPIVPEPIAPEPAPPRQTEALSGVPAPRVPDQAGGPGLLLVARRGDTLPSLYRQVYAGLRPPSYAEVVAANPGVVRPGTRLIFPTPPGGWHQQ